MPSRKQDEAQFRTIGAPFSTQYFSPDEAGKISKLYDQLTRRKLEPEGNGEGGVIWTNKRHRHLPYESVALGWRAVHGEIGRHQESTSDVIVIWKQAGTSKRLSFENFLKQSGINLGSTNSTKSAPARPDFIGCADYTDEPLI